jgi:type IV pilus assembly protein PilZ
MSGGKKMSADRQPGAARSSVLSLVYKEKAALYAAYMPWIKTGGIFVPTNRVYALGDDVYLLLSLMDSSEKLPISGKVVWITPAEAQGNKVQGVGIAFPADESGQLARTRIEILLGSTLKSRHNTHTL